MLLLYAHYLSFGDAAYPGGDGYIIRTIPTKARAGAQVVLEASTAWGETAVVDRFIDTRGGRDDLWLPQTLEVNVSDEAPARVRQAPTPT